MTAENRREHSQLRQSAISSTKLRWGMAADRLSTAVWFLLAVPCVALGAYVLTRAPYSGEDSWYPMTRAIEFLHGQQSSESVYGALFFAGHVKFQYPPTALLSLDFLNALGVTTPYTLNVINAGLLIATGLVYAGFSRQILGQVKWFGIGVPIGPIAFLVAVRFYPNNLAFQIGQMQVLLGLLFLLACWAFLNERLAWAGALMGAAASVKPQFAPLGLSALWRRQWWFLAGLIPVLSVIFALSVALYGWRTHLDYLAVLDFLSKHGEYQHLNQSINGVLIRWFYSGPSLDRDPSGLIPQSAFPPFIEAVYAGTLASTAILFVIPFAIRRRSDDRISQLLEFCSAAVLFTMASPIAWVHHYNILLPAYVVALKAGFDRWTGARIWVVLSLLLLSFVAVGFPLAAASNPTNPSLNLVQSHVLIGAFVLVSVLLVELRTPLRHGRDQPVES